MNEVINAMTTRRSIRKFTAETVPEKLLEEVIEAGLYAASGKGRQSPVVVNVADAQWQAKIREANRSIGGWAPGFDPFYGAPHILIVLVPRECPTRVYDGSLVMGNLMLAAHALGLGAIWIHRAREEFELPEFQRLTAELGLPGAWEGVGHCAVGYAADPLPPPPPRRSGRVFRV